LQDFDLNIDVMNESERKTKKAKLTNWWAAVWRGLVVDKDGKHYHNIRSALWLYLYLLIHAKRETGLVFQSYKTIAAAMGVSERTVRNWMAQLTRYQYVAITKTGRAPIIRIKKWKPWGKLEMNGKTLLSSDKTAAV